MRNSSSQRLKLSSTHVCVRVARHRPGTVGEGHVKLDEMVRPSGLHWTTFKWRVSLQKDCSVAKRDPMPQGRKARLCFQSVQSERQQVVVVGLVLMLYQLTHTTVLVPLPPILPCLYFPIFYWFAAENPKCRETRYDLISSILVWSNSWRQTVLLALPRILGSKVPLAGEDESADGSRGVAMALLINGRINLLNVSEKAIV